MFNLVYKHFVSWLYSHIQVTGYHHTDIFPNKFLVTAIGIEPKTFYGWGNTGGLVVSILA
jgi:hypothetical protein